MYRTMTMSFVLILPFVLPVWPYSESWGFQPAMSLTVLYAALSILRVMKLL